MLKIEEIATELIDGPKEDLREKQYSEDIEELATSIETIGLIQPITVFQNRERYEIVVGHRRYLACKMAGIKKIPAIVRIMKPGEMDIMKIDENIFREDVSPVQIAKYIYKIMTDREMSTMEIARYLGKTPQWVNSMLRLLDTDEYTQKAVENEDISYVAALELQKVEDPGYRRALTEAAVRGGANTRLVKNWVQEYKRNEKAILVGSIPEETLSKDEENEKYRMRCSMCNEYYRPDQLITVQVDPQCYTVYREMAKNWQNQLKEEDFQKRDP